MAAHSILMVSDHRPRLSSHRVYLMHPLIIGSLRLRDLGMCGIPSHPAILPE